LPLTGVKDEALAIYEKQIPFGKNRQKGNDNSKGKGGFPFTDDSQTGGNADSYQGFGWVALKVPS